MRGRKTERFAQSASMYDSMVGPPWLALFVFLIFTFSYIFSLPAYAVDGKYILDNTPAYVPTATNLGAANPSDTIEVSIWLEPHNRSALDTLVHELYDPASPAFRRWLKPAEVVSQFAPTPAEAKTVQEFLESNGLKVVKVGPYNFYVRGQGTVAQAEKAFQIQINDYQVGKQTIRANASDPYVEGPAAALVQAVSGLDNGEFTHPLDLRPTNFSSSSGKLFHADLANETPSPGSSPFQSVCFTGIETEKYGAGSYPNATYKGNAYYSGSVGCGYSPANIYAAYNLNGLYAEGHNGAGQTVAIIDWCGSPTIQADANAFSTKFGLPKLTASNFSIINYPAPSACSGVDLEINLDVEWSHAIAPGAAINLVVPPTPDFEDVDEAVFYAVLSGLGSVISGSYASPEFFVSGTELNKENLISEIAAVSGVATNFASGDEGNYGAVFLPPTVSVPADLPYATGVGGVSLALNPDHSIAFQTGWETHESILSDEGTIYDPPHPLNFTGFGGGSGGGPSAFFAKPPFQKGVPGKYRQVPDIAWLADPFTGAVVVISQPGQLPLQVWYVAGGTSLATPMFSALWAIANQEAGTALGQAAPYLYAMPSTTITDVVPRVSATDVTAVVQESSSVIHRYNPAQTLEVIPSLFGGFYSVIWNPVGTENTALAVSFGEDYYLKTKVGWDEVTGLGTPNAKAFADWFAAAPSMR